MSGSSPRWARPAGTAQRRWPARRSGPPSAGCPWSRRGTSWSGRGRTAPAARSRRAASWPPSQPAEQVDHLTAGQVGPQRDIPGDVGQPPVEGRGVAPRVRPSTRMRPRRRAACPAAGGWLSTSRHRSGPRKPCTSPLRTTSPVRRARTGPKCFTAPDISTTALTGRPYAAPSITGSDERPGFSLPGELLRRGLCRGLCQGLRQGPQPRLGAARSPDLMLHERRLGSPGPGQPDGDDGGAEMHARSPRTRRR